jgi:hypothetical protein
MPDNITELLSKAIAAKIASRQPAPPVKAKGGHSYSITCNGCKSVTQFTDEDLPNFRTDPETGSTESDEDPEEEDPDGDDNDSEFDDRAGALTKRILRASAKQKH